MKPEKTAEAQGLSASDWEQLFRRAGIEVEKLDAAKSKRAKVTILGNWLARNADREVAITVGDRTGKARLLIREGRSKKKCYVFEVHWDVVDGDEARRDLEARGLEGESVSKPTTMSGAKKKVKRKSTTETREMSGVTNKPPTRTKPTQATGNRKKAVAKKKVSLPKKSETTKPSALNNQTPDQGHQQGNTESW